MLPVFILFFIRQDGFGYLMALAVLCLMESTDIIDGYIARKYEMTSDIGKLLDPMADTITRICMFLTFFHCGLLPLWMMFVFFVRDMAIAYMRAFLAVEGIILGARTSGKFKAMSQAFATGVGTLFMLLSCQEELKENPELMVSILSVSILIIIAIYLLLKVRGPLLAVPLIIAPLVALSIAGAYYYDYSQIDWKAGVEGLLFISALITLFSFYDYTRTFVQAMKSVYMESDQGET